MFLFKDERKKILLLSLILLGVMFLSVLFYVSNIKKKLLYSLKIILDENAKENIDDLKRAIDDRIEFLKNIDVKNFDIEQNKYFDDLEIINRNGVGESEFYNELLKNKICIRKINYQIEIMLLKNNYVLCAKCNLKDLNNIFMEQDFNGYVANYFINNAGQIILKNIGNRSLNLAYEENNFLGIVLGLNFKTDNEAEKMICDLKNKKDGFCEFEYNSRNYVLSYKIVGINDWYLFSIVEKNILNAQEKNILLETKKLLFINLGTVVLFTAYLLFVNKKYLSEIKKTSEKLNLLMENIPGGVLTKLNNKYFDLIYISDGFLGLVDYSRDEIKSFFCDKYLNMIYSDDVDLLKKSISEHVKEKNNFGISYRIKKKNGKIIWVAERGKLIDKYIYSVVLDITEQKNILDELKVSNEKYKLIAEESDSIIFEINLKTGLAISQDNFKKMLGFDLAVNGFPENAIKKKLIYHEDIKVLYDLVKDINTSQDFYEIEFRIKNKSEKFIWLNLFIKLIFDRRKLVKAVGKIKNINDIKIKQEELKVSAEIDLLTGLYNKVTSEELIDKYLLSDGKNKISALFAIDLDNFKNVNDNLGHLKGDKVLVDVAQKLKNIFRKTDIIARFGGDEFIIFAKDIGSIDLIPKKAEKIIKDIKCEVDGNKTCVISASIGVAIYPEAGTDFKNLYKNADDVLYQAKKSGKNAWLLFKIKKK